MNLFYHAFKGLNEDDQVAPILAVLMTVILLICNFVNGFSQDTVTTRIFYALARDGGIPGGVYLSKLNKETRNPDRISILSFCI